MDEGGGRGAAGVCEQARSSIGHRSPPPPLSLALIRPFNTGISTQRAPTRTASLNLASKHPFPSFPVFATHREIRKNGKRTTSMPHPSPFLQPLTCSPEGLYPASGQPNIAPQRVSIMNLQRVEVFRGTGEKHY